MVLYIAVTKDKYELPVAVADSVGELSQMTGATKNSILSCISHGKRDGRHSQYHKVVDEDDK